MRGLKVTLTRQLDQRENLLLTENDEGKIFHMRVKKINVYLAYADILSNNANKETKK